MKALIVGVIYRKPMFKLNFPGDNYRILTIASIAFFEQTKALCVSGSLAARSYEDLKLDFLHEFFCFFIQNSIVLNLKRIQRFGDKF